MKLLLPYFAHSSPSTVFKINKVMQLCLVICLVLNSYLYFANAIFFVEFDDPYSEHISPMVFLDK